LRVDPSSQSAAEGRARIAIQLREAGAAEHCAKALAFHETDPELQLQMIATAASELGPEAIPLLETYLGHHPQDVRAHELIADLRAQAGHGEAFVDSYVAALAESPDSKPLLMSYWSVLSRSGRHMQALESIDRKRSLFEGDRDFAILEVAIAGHAREIDRAGRILDGMDEGPDAQMARGLNRLQSGRPEDAARILETVVSREPDNLEAWALLELAWRVTSDSRHDWLVGQPGLYGARELELSPTQLGEIGTALRGLHQANAHPIGQSLRGGTQTSGQLFLRSEPEVVLLIEALAVAIRDFVGKLPVRC
jgi:tetratricopeptide (TPR) repeat protein